MESLKKTNVIFLPLCYCNLRKSSPQSYLRLQRYASCGYEIKTHIAAYLLVTTISHTHVWTLQSTLIKRSNASLCCTTGICVLISGLIKFRKVLYLNYSIHFIYFDC